MARGVQATAGARKARNSLDRELALRAMALQIFRAAAFPCGGFMRAQLVHELLHPVAVCLKYRVGWVDVVELREWNLHLSPCRGIVAATTGLFERA